MRFTVDRLDHVVINCGDVELTASWYQRVLGMEREEFGADRRTALKFGGQKLNLRPHDHDARAWFTGVNSKPGAMDLCFIAAVGPDDVVEHLRDCGVPVEAGPVPKQARWGRSSRCTAGTPMGT